MWRLALLFSLVSSPAAADAAAILDHLGKTPATRLDLSMARVNTVLTVVGEKNGFGAFAWQQDGGVVIMGYVEKGPRTEAACRNVIEAIRRAGDIDPKSGEPLRPASAYASLFNYPGQDNFKIDQSYAETVDAMFRLIVTVGTSGDGKAVVCKAPLVNGPIAYSRE